MVYINLLIVDRNLDVELIKVKAYAGDLWNELVDRLAKKRTDNMTYHQLSFNYGLQNYKFSPYFKQTLIEQRLRAMGQVQAYSEWKDL
ncbi:hypothetical protein RCL_jg17179.t1 [Rhizophagus clarus]|uniref:Uncharacterized protein n=1 Tax=Rhizophagus clarus TaxID=94130 RepID=A0A8H3LNB3_9GLOM|nr:hypothetical protein RCL_jg17179.t1 [Rhizophagus clarus]